MNSKSDIVTIGYCDLLLVVTVMPIPDAGAEIRLLDLVVEQV